MSRANIGFWDIFKDETPTATGQLPDFNQGVRRTKAESLILSCAAHVGGAFLFSPFFHGPKKWKFYGMFKQARQAFCELILNGSETCGRIKTSVSNVVK